MSFIFQAVPERYDLRVKMKVSQRASWVVSRFGNEMKRGDIVYFWLGGDPAERGLYGWGVITDEKPIFYEDSGYRIEVEYRRFFPDYHPSMHIPSEEIRADPALENHLIFRMPVGTNFMLTDEEDQAIRAIIARKFGEDWLPPKPAADGGGGG